MRPIYFNGKFYAAGLNGVHRVADRLIRQCDELLGAIDPAARPVVRLLLPERRSWQPRLAAILPIEQKDGHRQLWEQLVLPRRTADGVLVNLANLAPLAHRRKLMLIHDAQFLFPDSSYPWRQRMGYRLLVPRMAQGSACVLTVSDYSRQMLDLLGVAPRASTQLLYNGADHILEAPADPGTRTHLALAPGSYALLFGSTKAYKNIRVVLDAFSAGALAPLRLVIVGPDRDMLVGAGLVPPADAVFAGAVDDAALRDLYSHAHCLLFPSRTEGFGLPPVEAMLCGCPVVASPAGAIPEVCRDAVLYADVDDPASWRDAIAAMADPGHRAAKQEAGHRRAGHFTWARAGKTLFGHILRLAAEPG